MVITALCGALFKDHCAKQQCSSFTSWVDELLLVVRTIGSVLSKGMLMQIASFWIHFQVLKP
jgi:hypothetical protein